MAPADPGALKFTRTGRTLTAKEFEEIMDDLSRNHIGIRVGRGLDRKNLVSNVVKIELSGPRCAPFSILDLPGLISSTHAINEWECTGLTTMILKYIRARENIVVCVMPGYHELDREDIYGMALANVDQSRLIGVCPQCDRATEENMTAIVQKATGRGVHQEQKIKSGLFVVRNRTNGEDMSFDLTEAENQLFGQSLWTKIPLSRRGTSKLKHHLAGMLSSRIAEDFPHLEASIRTQLADKLSEEDRMGKRRNDLPAKRSYISRYVHRFSEQALLALRHPGNLESSDVEVRQQVRDLNNEFETIMRLAGKTWHFQDPDIDPRQKLNAYKGILDTPNITDEEKANRVHALLKEQSEQDLLALGEIKGFEKYKEVGSLADFGVMIKAKLRGFSASQPPCVVNSDIYPIIYRMQVQKWALIAEEHLRRVKEAIRRGFEGIFQSLRLDEMLSGTFKNALKETQEYCKNEVERELLQTTDPRFGLQLFGWRFLRYARSRARFLEEQKEKDLQKESDTFELMYNFMGDRGDIYMCLDIHDVVKVFYEISVEGFIRHITQSIVENFVMDKNGPLLGLDIKQYVLSLSDEDMHQMGSEDSEMLWKRQDLEGDIKKLTGAQETAERARREMEGAAAAC